MAVWRLQVSMDRMQLCLNSSAFSLDFSMLIFLDMVVYTLDSASLVLKIKIAR
jgi:hypothetical protein